MAGAADEVLMAEIAEYKVSGETFDIIVSNRILHIKITKWFIKYNHRVVRYCCKRVKYKVCVLNCFYSFMFT